MLLPLFLLQIWVRKTRMRIKGSANLLEDTIHSRIGMLEVC